MHILQIDMPIVIFNAIDRYCARYFMSVTLRDIIYLFI